MMAMSREFCEDFQPPPLPPESSNLFPPLYDFIRNNQTHWTNFLTYHDLCNVTLPDSASRDQDCPEDESSTVTSTVLFTSPSTLPVRSANVAVPIIIALLVVALAIGLAIWWWKVKTRRGRENLPSLPLKEYESTNYLDNKARNNQCWSPQKLGAPDLDTDSGSQDKMGGIEKVVAVVEPFMEVRTDKLCVVKGFNDVNSPGLELGCQNYSYTTDRNENRSPVSTGASSMTPLFDSIDGGLLPNVPEINPSLPGDKPANHYSPFPELPKSDVSNVPLQGPLPPLDTVYTGSTQSVHSPPTLQTESGVELMEHNTDTHLICEDLIEARKSV